MARKYNTPPIDVGDIYDISMPSGILTSAWYTYLPRGCKIFYSEYSGIFFIQEINNGSIRHYTLDRIANVAKNKKGNVSAYGKNIRLSKKHAEQIAGDLRKQAKKLENLAQSYKLIASAITVSIDDIEEIVMLDETVKKALTNPF